jgi:hypothetical protein
MMMNSLPFRGANLGLGLGNWPPRHFNPHQELAQVKTLKKPSARGHKHASAPARHHGHHLPAEPTRASKKKNALSLLGAFLKGAARGAIDVDFEDDAQYNYEADAGDFQQDIGLF